MISLISILSLLLKWFLILQNPTGEVLEKDSENFLCSIDSRTPSLVFVQEDSGFEESSVFWESWKEEKNEVEEEALLEKDPELTIFYFCNPIDKPLRKVAWIRPGKGLFHLYDFYHSWKIALS